MNHLIEIEDRRPERVPRRQRFQPITRVTLVENAQAFEDLLLRAESELAPQNVQQEGDLIALTQLRWRVERIDLMETHAINAHLLQVKLPVEKLTNEEHLAIAYQQAVCDHSYNQIQKNYLASAKTMHYLAARVEKWKNKREGHHER